MWCLDPYGLQWLFGFLSWFLPVFSVYCLQSQYIWRVRILISCQTTFSLRVATYYRLHVAATRRGSRSLLVHRSGDMLRDTFKRKLFRVYWSLCLRNRILLPQRFAQIQIHLILRYLWPLSKERQRNGIFGFGRARNDTRAKKKWKRGEGRGRGRGSNPMAHPLPALLLALFFARSLTLVPCSLFWNRTETLATQAKCVPTLTLTNCWGFKPVVYFVWLKPSKDRIEVYLIITLFQSQRAWLISPFPSCFLLKLLTKRDWWRRKRLPFAFGENQLLSCEILSFMNTAKRNDAPDNLEQRILDILTSR